MALLEANSVCKSFGALKAVDNVTFTVTEGEILGIAGPNGSGKSTLFNAITKIPFSPDSGSIVFDGKSLERHRPQEIARLGLVRTFQREIAFEGLNVFENAWLAGTFGAASRIAVSNVSDVLELVGFTQDDFGRSARDLSVFERKRLMLASAIVCSPRIILLDEPASGLTKPEIEETITLIRRIAKEGVAILLIEHVLPVLMTLSHRLLVLNNGQMLGMGDPVSIMREPVVIEAYLGNRKVEEHG